MKHHVGLGGRRLTVGSLFRVKNEPDPKRIYKYLDGEELIQVLSDTFNIVVSRDIRKNVRIAADIAAGIAREHPEKDVFYLNTYAGVTLMKEAFAEQLRKASLPVPAPIPESEQEVLEPIEIPAILMEEAERLAQLRIAQPQLFTHPGAMYVAMKGTERYLRVDPKTYKNGIPDSLKVLRVPENMPPLSPSATSSDEISSSSQTQSDEPEMLPNLHIHNVAFGEWNTEELAKHIREEWHEVRPVVVMNSFEFASVSPGQRSRMVTELIDLQRKMGLTVVIFSHEMRLDRAAGVPGRGALGALCGRAGAVTKLADPFEHLIRSRDGEKDGKNGVIHEAQMHRAKLVAARKLKEYWITEDGQVRIDGEIYQRTNRKVPVVEEVLEKDEG